MFFCLILMLDVCVLCLSFSCVLDWSFIWWIKVGRLISDLNFSSVTFFVAFLLLLLLLSEQNRSCFQSPMHYPKQTSNGRSFWKLTNATMTIASFIYVFFFLSQSPSLVQEGCEILYRWAVLRLDEPLFSSLFPTLVHSAIPALYGDFLGNFSGQRCYGFLKNTCRIRI